MRNVAPYTRPAPLRWRLALLGILAALAAGGAVTDHTAATDATKALQRRAAAPPTPSPLILDETPPLLVPKRPRTEADQDRLEALSLFAAARHLEQREEYTRALRLYQRALRRDPQAVAAARLIIPLAFRLNRHAEAVRYALKAAEIEDADPLLLRRLGIYLTEEGDWEHAVKLYERALAARSDEQPSGTDVLLLMEMGRLYHLLGDFKKASDCFARVGHALDRPKESSLDERLQKSLVGEPGPTYNLIGESFMLADRSEEAVAAFEKAQRLAPNRGLLEYNLARVYLRSGKADQALEALQRCYAEKLSSEGTAPYDLLADVLEKLGKKDELITRLEKLHAVDAENIRLGYSLAGRYREARDFDKAAPLYQELLKKSPALTGYRSLVEIYRKTRQAAALLAVLGEAVEQAGVLDALGAEAQAVAGDAELMRGLVETARAKLKDQPQQLSYGMRLAVALLAVESKQYDTAGEFFELSLKAKPAKAAELLLVWGVALLVGERPADAAAVFQRAIDQKVLAEGDPLFYFYLAGARAIEEQTDQALAAARKAAEIKPDSARFVSRIGWVLYHAKRYDEAIKAYAELIERFDDEYDSAETRDVLHDARLALSNLCVLQGQLSQAEEWLEQVLDEFPDDVGAANDLGYLWADQAKHLERSLKMIQRAVAAEPDNSAYRDSLGWAFYRLGQYPQAVTELEKATAAAPEGVILDHLGDAYLKANEPQKAKDAWRRAVEALEKEKEVDKAKEVSKKIKD